MTFLKNLYHNSDFNVTSYLISKQVGMVSGWLTSHPTTHQSIGLVKV